MRTRLEFGKLVDQYRQLGYGAEIGVKEGNFSKLIGEDWKGKVLCVDVWDSSDDFTLAKQNLADYNKFELIRGRSTDVAKSIKPGSLDWVYIDADHSYESIKEDFEAWYPRVREGGIVAGHDYGDNGFGVKKFMDELGIKFNLTIDDFWEGKEYQSWWFIK